MKRRLPRHRRAFINRRVLRAYVPSKGEGITAPYFSIKCQPTGEFHMYETPDVACYVDLSTMGTWLDAVDMDGNPVELRRIA